MVGGGPPDGFFFQNLVETSQKCAFLYTELNVKNQIELSKMLFIGNCGEF